jgi:pimeloyl-ACP methyl ester carboxylesterase
LQLNARPTRGLLEGQIAMTHTHQTAPTQFVEAKGIRFAYRRFGAKGSGVPLVFNQHFMGTMDYWDPAVTDGIAKTREVILFDNAGISSSTGDVPTTFQQMGANAIAFINALGLNKVDVLGFSIGGMVAQEITVQATALVRRLILVGTGPRAAEGMWPRSEGSTRVFGATYDPPEHLWLAVHFSPSASSQAAGLAFLERKHRRQHDRDPEVNDKVVPAQAAAIAAYSDPSKNSWDYLKQIAQPTLVVNGSNDIIIPTVNSFILQQNLPNAQLILYPDANHGSQYQYPELFVADVEQFLSASQEESGEPNERLPFPAVLAA